MLRSLLVASLAAVTIPTLVAAQGAASGAIAGRVVSAADDAPVAGASVVARAGDRVRPVEAIADQAGTFVLSPLEAGVYSLSVRLPGFQAAVLSGVRVLGGDTVRVRVVLAPSATPLSTVLVLRSPVDVDPLDPASSRRIPTETATLLPTARDASAIVALVPGAKDGRLWGGAGTATNDYRVDGVSMNHPGAGGEFLRLPREWVDAVEVRGIGANAEFGDFQGGVLDARTRRGGNERQWSMRSFHDSPRLSGSNLTGDEIGAEPAGRTEFGGEASGPLVRDRLFYFVGAQSVERASRAPALGTPERSDFLGVQEHGQEFRGLAKVSAVFARGARLDLALGAGRQWTDAAGLDGLDDPSALPRLDASHWWYGVSWQRALGTRTTIEARAAGYDADEALGGTLGSGVPSVRPIRAGDAPRYQNSEFDLRRRPSSHSAAVTVRRAVESGALSHAIAAGVSYSGGGWRETRLRDGGLTWRPYVEDPLTFSPTDASTWTTVGSDWGGEVRLGAASQTAALFVQDEVTIGSRVTIAPGVRVSSWGGWLVPCTADAYAPECALKMRAVRATGFDPRLGLAWDVTGRGTLAIKAQAGRFHQAMFAGLYDRVAGANAYTNERFYYTAPPLVTSREVFTAAERDLLVGPAGFSPFHDVRIRDESGIVRGYRQPYVDQLSLAVERRIGRSLKLALLAVHRRNGDIVGLVDRNLASNYTRLTNIAVSNPFVPGGMVDANGDPLVLRELLVPNRDLIDAVTRLNLSIPPNIPPRRFDGWGPAEVAALTWDPRIELAPIPEAQRRYDQLTAAVTLDRGRWSGEGSLTLARLYGNVAGVTGHGSTGTRFSAGPYVRPNEGINSMGLLPDATEFEAKVWMTATLPFALRGGVLFTHILGERMTPTFSLEGRYRYFDSNLQLAPQALTQGILGQVVFVEPRGSRHYASRSLLDLHLERGFARRAGMQFVVSTDVINALGSRAVTRVKTEIDDQMLTDPTSRLGAPRGRVAPRSLRIGLRVESTR